ncbi:MAG TPA: hypothetical protein VMG98_05985 [Verrucomicrobiae bacterium]|nr:hypothetical protein [Verrucomicrobiae bacterium]
MNFKKCALALAAVFCVLATLAPGAADANGVVRVQQSDGSVREYPQTAMRWTGQTLWLHSADGKGVLEITTAACSYAVNLVRCLPYAITLHQNGAKRSIAVAHGTIYMNFSTEAHRVPYSSESLAAHHLLVAIRTQHGTYITVRGHVDEVKE